VLLPGITLNTSATDYRPIKDGCMVEFRDGRFVVVCELLHGNSAAAVRKHFQRGRSREPPARAAGSSGARSDKEDRDGA